MKLTQGDRLVMIGDSITDCGRAQPVGEAGGLGGGYVQLVESILLHRYPELRIRVTNTGTSGHTVRDLAGRWQRDVLDLNPDWVSVMIGINDVWRQFDCYTRPELGVPLEEYRATLASLVDQTLPNVKGLVLLSPFFIEPLPQDPMRARMDQYGAAVREIAQEKGLPFGDVQAAFDRLLRHMHSASIAWDRVHPGQLGHLAIAQVFLDTIGA